MFEIVAFTVLLVALALPPLPPSLGVDEATRFLRQASGKAISAQCDLERLDSFPSQAEFKILQLRPFVITKEGAGLPKFRLNDLRKAKPKKTVRVVLDPEYGTLAQRRAAGYYDCYMSWEGFVEYWALPAGRLAQGRHAAQAMQGCGAPRGQGEAPEKRTFYGRHDGEPLHALLEPALKKLPLYTWRGSERTQLNSWISTQGARTPMHVDSDVWQAFLQLRGEKQVVILPPNSSLALLQAVAEWPGLPDHANLKKWSAEAGEVEPLLCRLLEGEMLWMPKGWPHDVFTLTDSFTTIIRWGTPFFVDNIEL